MNQRVSGEKRSAHLSLIRSRLHLRFNWMGPSILCSSVRYSRLDVWTVFRRFSLAQGSSSTRMYERKLSSLLKSKGPNLHYQTSSCSKWNRSRACLLLTFRRFQTMSPRWNLESRSFVPDFHLAPGSFGIFTRSFCQEVAGATRTPGNFGAPKIGLEVADRETPFLCLRRIQW